MPRCILCIAITLLAAARCLAQDTSALINKALDEQVKLNINDTLPRAIGAITEKTGVKIEVDPVVWDLLVWGQDTNISAKIENKTLREALELMTRKLGLTFVLKDESIEVCPVPALWRLARRSTVQELQALDLLASNPANLPTDRPTIKQILEAVDKQLEKLADPKSPLAIENRTFEVIPQDKPVFVPRNATLMDALESLHKETRATWYPWGKNIIITTKEDRIRAQLDRKITVRYNGLDISQVLLELARHCGVRFDIQSGAVLQLSPESRSIRGYFQNASVGQILEAIAGSTGLAYVVKEDGVYVWNPSGGKGSGVREPAIGLIQLDNGVQVIILQSQVSPELREYIKYKTQKELEKLKQRMEEEGFKPATQPATQPDGRDL